MLNLKLDHHVVDLAHRYDVDPSFLDDLHATPEPAGTDRVRRLAAAMGFNIRIVESEEPADEE